MNKTPLDKSAENEGAAQCSVAGVASLARAVEERTEEGVRNALRDAYSQGARLARQAAQILEANPWQRVRSRQMQDVQAVLPHLRCSEPKSLPILRGDGFVHPQQPSKRVAQEAAYCTNRATQYCANCGAHDLGRAEHNPYCGTNA